MTIILSVAVHLPSPSPRRAAVHLLSLDPVSNPKTPIYEMLVHDTQVGSLTQQGLKGFPYGRERVAGLLERDEAQCFRAAGLFDEPPSPEVVLWWDRFAQTVRVEIDDRLLLQGREAERLSLAHERDRLKMLGVAREPRWMAIENNAAGFDILSFDKGPVEPISRLIEVKSSTHNPPRIILTRNEWEAATRFGESYIFHIWTLPVQALIERSVAQMIEHIPLDRGSGEWGTVEIAMA